METKQMNIANFNLVFGKNEDPLLKWLDEIVLPALKSGKVRESTKDTNFIFEDIEVEEVVEGELVLRGAIIKDTVLEVLSEYSKETGLEKTDKQVKSSPYSVFMIFLKNHRMVLVKNQKGSPDLRSFISTIKDVMGQYISEQNLIRKEKQEKLLPRPFLNVTGIKTADNIKSVLKDVEKIEELTFKFFPLNAEWDVDPLFGGIDILRKNIQAKKGKMVFPSPESKDGVADMIESTEGLAKAEMKVRYKNDLSYSGSKKRGTIKDNQISENVNIDVNAELDEAYSEIYAYKKDIKALNVISNNNIILYEEYLNKKKSHK